MKKLTTYCTSSTTSQDDPQLFRKQFEISLTRYQMVCSSLQPDLVANRPTRPVILRY